MYKESHYRSLKQPIGCCIELPPFTLLWHDGPPDSVFPLLLIVYPLTMVPARATSKWKFECVQIRNSLLLRQFDICCNIDTSRQTKVPFISCLLKNGGWDAHLGSYRSTFGVQLQPVLPFCILLFQVSSMFMWWLRPRLHWLVGLESVSIHK